MLCFINIVKLQTWSPGFDTTVVGVTLSFNFTNDVSRQITTIKLSQDETALYGMIEGGSNVGTNKTYFFKSDVELAFTWIRLLDANVSASQGFELDSTESTIYFNSRDGNWNIFSINTTDGSVGISFQIDFGTIWYTTISSDDQSVFVAVPSGKPIKFIKQDLFQIHWISLCIITSR